MARRKITLKRRAAFRPLKRLFVIATEGNVTEPYYFDQFRNSENASIKIEILRSGNKSNPRAVFKRLDKYRKEHKIEKKDELWLVIDKDNWNDLLLNNIANGCRKFGYFLAVSNPCFEFWLYLHVANPKSFCNADQCISELIKELGRYEKSNYNLEVLKPGIPEAIRRAETLDQLEAHNLWPKNSGTRVYILVKKIISS